MFCLAAIEPLVVKAKVKLLKWVDIEDFKSVGLQLESRRSQVRKIHT
jgi:hypothetical protein